MPRSETYSTAYEDTAYVDPLEQAIRDYIATGPSPAELAAAMAQYGVSAEQISQATNFTVEQVNNYVAPAQEIDYAAQQREDSYAPVAQPVVPEVVVSAPVAPPPPPTPVAQIPVTPAPVAPPVQQPPTIPVVESAPVVPERVQYGAPAANTQATTAATTTTTTVTPPTVAQVTAAIDKWQTDNPGATPQQLAIAIRDGMGLTAEVTQALANKYNMSTTDIAASYTDLVSKPVTPTTTVLPPTVAQVTAAIDKWTTDNPGATPAQLATAIKNGMGLTPEVTQALANKYNMSTADITTNFNTLVAQPVVPPTTTTTTTTAPTVAQVRAAIDTWTTANPDATPEQLAVAIQGGMGMNDTVAQALAEKYNSTPAAVVETYNRTLDPYAGVQVTDSEGKSYDAKTLIALATQVALNLDTAKSSGGAFNTKNENIGFDYNTLSSAYGNKAFTAGDQVSFDIARQLLNQGITNYDQVKNAKKTTITEQQTVYTGGDAGNYELQDVTREVYIDPATGQEINTRIGATYTGAGNTQYHIDPTTGKVYTTAESSSDISPAMMAALSIGASFLMPGVGAVLATELGISAAAGTALAQAGLQLAMGADPKTVLLNAGLNLSGITKAGGNFVQTGLENLTSGLPEGLLTEKMLSTAATAITRAGTTFLTTGSTTTALTAAAGSVINDVVTDKTGSTALGAGAAAYVQTGSLTTAALVTTNAAAYNAGVTNKQGVIDLFNGAKDTLLQNLTATQLTTSGITQTDLDNLFDPTKNPYLTSTDITTLAQDTLNTGVVTDAGAGTNDTRKESAWTAGPEGQRRWVEVIGTDGTTKYAGWETVDPVTGQIYGTITTGGVDKDGNPTDVYITGIRGGIPINVDVTKSDTPGPFSVKPVKPTTLTLGTTANTTPLGNGISTPNTVSTSTSTTSVPGNISVPGGNVVGVGNTSATGNVVVVGTTGTGNANVSIAGTGNANANVANTGIGNGNITIGGTGTGNVGNIVVGTTGTGNANVGGNANGNITVGSTGTGNVGNISGNGNITVGNVTTVGNVGGNISGNGNITVGNTTGNITGNTTGNITGNTTGNVSVTGNTVGNTVGNVSTVGNVITVINTPNTTPNVSTPITTTLGSSIVPLKFASGGLNPGYIAPTPFYQTTNDAQSKFYYGSRPYQTGGITGQVFDPVLYNTVPEAPRIPFGSQAVTQPLTSAQIAAIVANPSSNNSQQNTQQASTFVPAPVAPPPAPIVVPQLVAPPAPVAPPAQAAPQPVFQPAPVVSAPQPVQTPIAPEFTAPIQQPMTQPDQIPAGFRYAGADEIANGRAQYQPSTERYIISTTPVAPAAPAEPTFQMPAGFRYAGGDDMDAGTAIYNPILNGYIAPLTNTAGPVVP